MNQNNTDTKNNSPEFNLGKEIFSWDSYDYHPHNRGIIWYIVFCSILFGGAVWSMISDPKWGWLMALSFFLAAAVYFYAHYKGDEHHTIKVFEQGIFIDKKFIALENFAGFWFLYDETISVINFELKSKYKRNDRISLQMGKQSPEFFRENMSKISLNELKDTKESLIDLWIRALKL